LLSKFVILTLIINNYKSCVKPGLLIEISSLSSYTAAEEWKNSSHEAAVKVNTTGRGEECWRCCWGCNSARQSHKVPEVEFANEAKHLKLSK
jgi:hypothetical protein